MPCWVPDNEELVLKVLGQLPLNKWNTYAPKKLQKIQLDTIPEELRNFRITGFNEIKNKLNQNFSNDIKPPNMISSSGRSLHG